MPPTSSSQIDLPKTGSKKEATNNKIARTEGNTTAALPSYHSEDLDQLEEMVKSMMEKSLNKLVNRNEFAYLCMHAQCVEKRGEMIT